MAITKHSVLTGADIHVPHAIELGDYKAFGIYSPSAGDAGKLALEKEFGKLYFVNDSLQFSPVNNIGNSVIVVDPNGGGNCLLLSEAFALCNGSTDYVIVVNGIVQETTTIVGVNRAHVKGMPGSIIVIIPEDGEPGVDLYNIVDNTVWQDVTIEMNNASGTHAVSFTGAENLTLKNVTATTLGTGSGFYATSYNFLKMENCVGTASASLDRLGNSEIGIDSKAFGQRNTATGDGSFVIGEQGEATYDNEFVHGGGNAFGSGRLGELQNREFFLTVTTATTDPTEALLINSGDRIVLPNLCLWKYKVTALAADAVVSSRFALLEYTGGIKRTTSAANTALIGTPSKNIDENSGFSGCSLTITADTSNGALKVSVVSGSASSTQWGIRVEALQMLGLAE